MNYILQNSFGYNFSRTAFYLKKGNYHILIPVFKNDSKQTVRDFFKKKILRLFNVIFVEFIGYSIDEQNDPLLPNIKFSYKGINISKAFYLRFVHNLNEYKNMCNAADFLFDKFNIKLVLSNMATSVNGYYLEVAKKKNIPSICIPHGSISEYFNKFDKIFKKQIAELQFNKQAKFFAIQSKITKNFIDSYNINHNCIETGNLLFSNNKNSKKNKIVFAVTLKSFEGLRYLGFENGLNSFKPTQPLEVLNRRFGDCKDKSLLLATLLQIYGLEAHPILVNSSYGKNINSKLPSPFLFDHCIVQYKTSSGEYSYLDPTISNQGGKIESTYYPNYYYGLILDDNTTQLSTLKEAQNSKTVLTEKFSMDNIGGGAILDIETTYFGGNADNIRPYLTTNNTATIQKDYTDFYSKLYPNIQVNKEVEILDDRQNNQINVIENYKIDSLWQKDSNDANVIFTSFYPSALENILFPVTTSNRKMPYLINKEIIYSAVPISNLPILLLRLLFYKNMLVQIHLQVQDCF